MAKIITAEGFSTLSIEEKSDILWKHGTFLNEAVEYGKFIVNIYELFNFFVGVYYDVDKNDIRKIEILKLDTDTLLNGISFN